MGSKSHGQLLMVVACLFAVYAFSIAQLKSDPLAPNEYMTISRSFNSDRSQPLTPAETVSRVANRSEQHGPAYFTAVSIWAAATGTDLATLRLLSVFFGLLTVATAYRLASITGDFRLAFFATLITSCTAFFIFFVHEVRMYSLLPLCSAWLVWSYWRLLSSPDFVPWWHWMSFFTSTAAILYVHYFGIFILAAVGIYHLIFAQKNRRWLRISLVAIAGGLMFLPWLPVAIDGLDTGYSIGGSYLNPLEALWVLMDVYTNGCGYLCIVLLACLLWRRQLNSAMTFILLVTLIAVGIALFVNEITTFFIAKRMRYSLVFLPLISTVFAIAFTLIPLPSTWRAAMLVILSCAWFFFFIKFSGSDRLQMYTESARWQLHTVPHFQEFSYRALIVRTEDEPIVSLHPSVELNDFTTKYYTKLFYPTNLVHIYYNENSAPTIQTSGKIIPDLSAFVAEYGSFWLIYKPHQANPQTMSGIFQWMHNYYRSCGRTVDKANAVIERFVRDSDPC